MYGTVCTDFLPSITRIFPFRDELKCQTKQSCLWYESRGRAQSFELIYMSSLVSHSYPSNTLVTVT